MSSHHSRPQLGTAVRLPAACMRLLAARVPPHADPRALHRPRSIAAWAHAGPGSCHQPSWVMFVDDKRRSACSEGSSPRPAGRVSLAKDASSRRLTPCLARGGRLAPQSELQKARSERGRQGKTHRNRSCHTQTVTRERVNIEERHLNRPLCLGSVSRVLWIPARPSR